MQLTESFFMNHKYFLTQFAVKSENIAAISRRRGDLSPGVSDFLPGSTVDRLKIYNPPRPQRYLENHQPYRNNPSGHFHPQNLHATFPPRKNNNFPEIRPSASFFREQPPKSVVDQTVPRVCHRISLVTQKISSSL